jgi:hypothetical protein
MNPFFGGGSSMKMVSIAAEASGVAATWYIESVIEALSTIGQASHIMLERGVSIDFLASVGAEEASIEGAQVSILT